MNAASLKKKEQNIKKVNEFRAEYITKNGPIKLKQTVFNINWIRFNNKKIIIVKITFTDHEKRKTMSIPVLTNNHKSFNLIYPVISRINNHTGEFWINWKTLYSWLMRLTAHVETFSKQ